MATLLQERYQSCGVSIWACSPARDDMCLVALSPPGLRDARDASVLDKRQAVIGSSVDTLAVREYDLNDYPPVWAISARAAGAKTVVTMPVVNRFNHHHIRFLVTLLQPEAGLYDYTQEAVRIGDCLARAADGALDDACAYAAGRVAFLADKVDTLKSFLVALRDLIVERVGCEGVTIFLQNRTGERLEPRETTGLEWAENVLDNERFYRVTDKKHPTVQCWQRNRTELIRKSTRQGRSFEKTSGDHAQADILLVPIMDIIPRSDGTQEQKAIGVIRCRNRRGQPTEREGVKPIFTDDDAAILDTICQTAVPHIELLRSLEERARSLGRIIHEIKKPINALRGKTDRLRTELSRVVPDYKERFRHDYIGQILSWTNISLRVIENGGFYGLASGFQKLEIKPEPTYLMGEVVAPVIGEIGFLLEERGFDASRIRYDRFEDIPRLNIDRNLFQQVFFNLLSNSIKYSYADRNQFGFEIRTARVGRYFCIFCSDWGPGIPEGMERAIFEEGVRGGDELNRYVPGMGLGLWVVREVVEAHGGYVGIESLGQPFTVSLNLPVSLRDSPPRRITR
jgi:signal transduction histidine kinase